MKKSIIATALDDVLYNDEVELITNESYEAILDSIVKNNISSKQNKSKAMSYIVKLSLKQEVNKTELKAFIENTLLTA